MGVFPRLAMRYLEMPSHQTHLCALPAWALPRPNAGAWCTVEVPAPRGLSTVRPATRASQNHSCFRSNNTRDAHCSVHTSVRMCSSMFISCQMVMTMDMMKRTTLNSTNSNGALARNGCHLEASVFSGKTSILLGQMRLLCQ